MSDLLSIDVNSHTKKKGGLTYLSWAWAWAEVLKYDPAATWVVVEHGPDGNRQPCLWIGDNVMVHTAVTVLGITRECWLPVMDNRNNAIKNPDARKISDAIMRCMTKAIAMHGLGLYIYAGEDLPQGDAGDEPGVPKVKGDIKGVMGAVLDNTDPLPNEELAYIGELAVNVCDLFDAKGAPTAYDRVQAEELSADQLMFLWANLPSNVRSGLKAEKTKRMGTVAA